MKKESKMKSKRKELKQTARGRAILKLIYWVIFFFLLLVFLLILNLAAPKENISTPPKEPDEPKVEEKPIIEDTVSEATKTKMENTLLNNKEYEYNFIITMNEEKYIYRGVKRKDENTGYKESPTGTIKYVINSEGIFSETTTNRTPIVNLYEETNFNFIELINEIKKVNYVRVKDCNCLNYIYNGKMLNNEYQLEFDFETKEIVSISVSKENIKYELTFKILGDA